VGKIALTDRLQLPWAKPLAEKIQRPVNCADSK